uniref:Phospholipid-transporting ATPase n=1 Tax=Spongospora subterranea TaxID=70186 RepID=A0A0H5QGP9_9EUKA|eukprot:CRZ01198.1 hypothetical protein [Spongospora subterranea]
MSIDADLDSPFQHRFLGWRLRPTRTTMSDVHVSLLEQSPGHRNPNIRSGSGHSIIYIPKKRQGERGRLSASAAMSSARDGMRQLPLSADGFEIEDQSSSSDAQFNQHHDRVPLLKASLDKVRLFLSNTWQSSSQWCLRRDLPTSRALYFCGNGCAYTEPALSFPANRIRNQKYSLISFFPLVLYDQFRYFFNLYFLVVACSQVIPELQVGVLFTYVAPLVFVVSVTMSKEAHDDFKRFRRDKEANSARYQVIENGIPKTVPSSSLRVGDLVIIHKDERVPADMVLLKTREESGEIFIRTDQLDGETDWKLRHALHSTKNIAWEDIWTLEGRLEVEAPRKAIYDFAGTFRSGQGASPDVSHDVDSSLESLDLEHTIWSNTVIATGSVVGCVIYTGSETRAVMNANTPSTKMGLVDLELNSISKLLFVMTIILAFVMVTMKGLYGRWPIVLFRFVLLFSAIIPISLRVNLDMAKTLYSYQIMKDSNIEDTVVRTSTIPEELGRISYLFSDKTGTLTQNVMLFKKLQLRPPWAHHPETLSATKESIYRSFGGDDSNSELDEVSRYERRRRIEADHALQACVLGIALCHNVTPVVDQDTCKRTLQASSPDEVALVRFVESLDIVLESRTPKKISLRLPSREMLEYDVLNIFPFTSESKRMGIVVRSVLTGEIYFYLKGAESVMRTRVEQSDWLDEEVEQLAREGLRTLVFGGRILSLEEYEAWSQKYSIARGQLRGRDAAVRAVVQILEINLTLYGVTGVEDKLQPGVKTTLETLRNAGIKIWMLTGDKAETAECIGRSARLVDRNQQVFHIIASNRREACHRLDLFGTRTSSTAVLIDGPSLALLLEWSPNQFIEMACQAPAVICCRCSPTQKAQVVNLVAEYTKRRCAAIGDGGNDVSMIQAAHVGIGIVGLEGKQASLAADFSVNQFSYIQRLILWHGRNSYYRSARMSQFVMHRGIIISVIQAVFSSLFYWATIPIYTGWLYVGYATLFTQLPVCALVLDQDVHEDVVNLYPELYQDLQKSRPLSYKTFLVWVLVSVYQGSVIMLLGMILFEDKFLNVVAITFTSLILSELLNVAFEIHHWTVTMVICEVASLFLYLISISVLKNQIDIVFVLSFEFVWKVSLITCCATLPVSIAKYLQSKFSPTTASKVH